MRISDWSSDVCSSDLRDRIRITDRDECREFGASVFDQFSRIDQERSLGAEKEHRALGVCRIQILNKEVASHEPAIIRAHRFAVNLGNQRSEEHTSELQSLMPISYAVFCLNKKNKPMYQIQHERK